MSGIGLAFLAALAWGGADFVAGLVGRRTALPVMLVGTQTAGLVLIGLVLAIRGTALPTHALVWGALAGALGLISISCLYRSLAVGTVSVVAPIVATSAAVPVIAGIILGDRPPGIVWAGIAAALVGVVLVSREPEHGRPVNARQAMALATVAAIVIGAQLVVFDRASTSDALAAVLAARVVTAAGFGLVLLYRRPPLRGTATLGVASVGVLDTIGNVTFTLATTRGLLSVVAMLSSAFPLITVALAHLRMHERLSFTQRVGAVLAVGGVMAIVST
jgi:drug/metabolite transporter (DMT)-like permease